MDHLHESKEIVEHEAEEYPQIQIAVPSDPSPPTKDVSIRGRIWEMGPPISASLGAMRPLVWNLDKLLRAPPPGCSSNSVLEGMHNLKNDVETLSSCLHDLAELEDPPAMAKCWMNEARDLSYDMDDYINSLFLRPAEDPCPVAHNIKTTRFRHKWFSRARTPKKLTWDEQIEGTVSEFRMYIKDAMKRYEVYNLKIFSTGRVVSVSRMLSMAYEETSNIVINGRMNEFINSLVPNNEANQLQLKVVSILGSSCLGKTTLARVLYKKLGKLYNCRAFVRVSKKPDTKTIFRDLLSQLQRQDPPKYCNEIYLINNIDRYVQDKRYLVIIDDLWDTTVWDIISRAFPKATHGSRIIITTEIEDVAFRCCRHQSENVFEMKPLDDHHSRKLFFNILFGSENSCPQPLKEASNKIVQICGGFPLATMSIASLLASQPMTEDILRHIHESLSSCFLASSTSERTRQALNLSFNHLPRYLKTCLLYLCIYPEGNIFWKHDLMKQWMAESFIDTAEGQDMEEVAATYLDELIGRRFIQPICVNYNNEVLSFVVHDTVNDLIAHKSAEQNFIVAIEDSAANLLLSHKARRLSLLFGNAIYAKIPANIGNSQVRSLTYYGFFESMPSITEFKLLRILNLQLCGHGRYDHPVDLSGISELFQLRYLKIVSDVYIKLPKHGLQCLETLEIRDAIVDMDRGVPCVPYIQLPRLLHLSLSDEINLVKWIDSLVSDGKLNNLQELRISTSSTFASNNVERIMGYLASIISLAKLKTIVVSHGLSVRNEVVPGAYEVADTVKDVTLPPLLQRFEFVTHNHIVFPRIFSSVEKHGNLSILKLEVRDLEMSCVDILRGLPALTALSLHVHTAPCQRIMFDKVGFSVLKYFKLRFTSGMAWLKFEADAMPNLWKLKLVFDAIPEMDQKVVVFSNHPLLEHHKCGAGVINIEHMPSIKEISVKFGGAAADVEYALRVGVINHPSNPTINKQPVDYSCYGDDRSGMKQQRDEILVEKQDGYDQKQPDEYFNQPDEILEEEPDEYYKQQPDENLDEEPDEILVEEQDAYDQKQPDEYYRQQPDKILEKEPEEYHKQQPDENLGEEPGEYKILERSANTRISSLPEFSPRHVRVKRGHRVIDDDEDNFEISGPMHMRSNGADSKMAIDWDNAEHRRCVMACLVKGTSVMENDRLKCRSYNDVELAPAWWESFGFRRVKSFVDRSGENHEFTYGAIFKLVAPSPSASAPEYVIAFRGTMLSHPKVMEELLQDFVVFNALADYTRFKRALPDVEEVLSRSDSVWLAGHSLGASMALEIGRNLMLEKGHNVPTFLFNTPHVSPAPAISKMLPEEHKTRLYTVSSVVKSALANMMPGYHQRTKQQFQQLEPWVPELFVNPHDTICRGYIDYFVERQLVYEDHPRFAMTAGRASYRDMLVSKSLPSARLWTSATHENEAHGLRQWWKSDSELELSYTAYGYALNK